jgi:hypothetical protein
LENWIIVKGLLANSLTGRKIKQERKARAWWQDGSKVLYPASFSISVSMAGTGQHVSSRILMAGNTSITEAVQEIWIIGWLAYVHQKAEQAPCLDTMRTIIWRRDNHAGPVFTACQSNPRNKNTI